MKRKIVYYSLTGSSEKVALRLAEELDTDIEKIKLKKHYSGVFFEVFTSLFGINKITDDMDFSLDGYSGIILISPMWGRLPAPVVNAYLKKANLKGKDVSIVIVRGGAPDEKFINVIGDKLTDKGASFTKHFTVNQSETKDGVIDSFINDIIKAL